MIELEHFTWRPLPDEGYVEHTYSESERINPNHFKPWFDEYLPIDWGSFYSNPDFRGYMIFNKPQSPFILFTSISWLESADEQGRPGPHHHSVAIKKPLVKKGKISILNVDDVLKEFKDEGNYEIKGTIEPLQVPERTVSRKEMLEDLKLLLTKPAIEGVVTRFLKNKNNKTILRCQGSKQSDRLKVAVFLLEYLNFNLKVAPLSITTERPRDKYSKLFNMAVTARNFTPKRGKESWRFIEWDAQKSPYKKLKKHPKVYKRIDKWFSYDWEETSGKKDRLKKNDQKRIKSEKARKKK